MTSFNKDLLLQSNSYALPGTDLPQGRILTPSFNRLNFTRFSVRKENYGIPDAYSSAFQLPRNHPTRIKAIHVLNAKAQRPLTL